MEKKRAEVFKIFLITLLVSLFFILNFGFVFAATSSAKSGIIIPLYTEDASTYSRIIQARASYPTVPITVIINPDSGPGDVKDSRYSNWISQLQNSGVSVIGYVYTSYGERDINDVENDIYLYKQYYPTLNGIFFDEMNNEPGGEQYYTDIVAYAKTKGFVLSVGNPGIDTTSNYIAIMNTTLIYEEDSFPSLSDYQAYASYDNSKLGMLPLNVQTYSEQWVNNASNLVGWMYITNDVLDDPWDTLSAHFEKTALTLSKTALVSSSSTMTSSTISSVNYMDKTYNILAIGDSNTFGAGNPTGCTSGCDGYRKWLWEMLVAKGYKVDFVGSINSGDFSENQHEGWSGMGIAKIQERINGGLLEQTNPDFILLMIGANDMWVSVANDRSPITTLKAQYWVGELGKLVDELAKRKPNAQIIIAKPTTPSNAKAPLGVFREGIDNLIQQKKSSGIRISSIDCAGLANDGVHFTRSGFYSLAERWFAEIDRVIKLPLVVTSTSTSTLSASVSEIIQYPSSASADSGSAGNVVSNKESSYSCSSTNFNGAWKKSTDTSSGKLTLDFATEVYPKQLVVYGIDSWFTKLEAWNGTGWKIIWMGESSNCITEMNVRQTEFKSKKYRLTTPIGKWGGVYAVKLTGSSGGNYDFPMCSNTGKKCAIGYVCTSSWKNSKDSSMCCVNDCETRFYSFAGDMSPGFTSLDLFRVAKNINMNYYRLGTHQWYMTEKDDEAHEWQSVIDFYEKTKNSNVNNFLSFVSGAPFSQQYNENLLIIQSYPNIKAAYGDDASNRGYKAIADNVLSGVSIASDFMYFFVGYSSHLSSWGSAFRTYFGSNSAVGKNVIWSDFGATIPCAVGNPSFGDIAKFNANGPANKVMIGLYVSSYSPFYCIDLRGMGSGWDPNDAAKQRIYWTQGIRAGAGGIFFWNPWMFSTNSRGIDYYKVGSFGLWPKVAPSSARDWTPSGVIVANTVDLAQKEIPDLCPYCALCGEDKIYMEDGFFGASCCKSDEIALGNDCFKKSTNYQWAKTSDRIEVIGEPADGFSCYGNKEPSSMWTISTTTNIPESSLVLEYQNLVSPNALVLYGSYMVIDKVEAWNGNSWVVLWNGMNKGYCLSTINFTKPSFTTNRIRLHVPSKNLGNLYKFTRSGIDAVMLISEMTGTSCTASNWAYTLGDCSNNVQLKTWIKTGNCSGGVSHVSSESVDCSTEEYPIVDSPIEEVEKIVDSDKDGIMDDKDKCLDTPIRSKVNRNGCLMPKWTGFQKTYKSTSTTGIVRDLQISNVDVAVVFEGEVVIERQEGALSFDDFMDLEKNKVTLDSTNLPELNVPAILVFKNVNISEPQISVDGKKCLDCRIISYSNGVLMVEVKHFSTYEVVEKKVYDSLPEEASLIDDELNATDESNETIADEEPLLPAEEPVEVNSNEGKNNPLADEESSPDSSSEVPAEKNNTWIYIVIAIVLLGVVGFFAYRYLKSKKDLDNALTNANKTLRVSQVKQAYGLPPAVRPGFNSNRANGFNNKSINPGSSKSNKDWMKE